MSGITVQSQRARVAIVILVQSVLLAWAAADRYFFVDDFLYFHEASTSAFLKFIAEPYFGHFAPLHRVLFWLLASFDPLNFKLAVGFEIAVHACSTWLLWRVLSRIAPSPMVPLVLSFFGTSLLFVKSLTWPSSGFQTFPCTALTLLALDGFLAALDVRLPGQAKPGIAWGRVRAVIGASLAPLFYVKGIFIPFIAVLAVLCLEVCRTAALSSRRRAVLAVLCVGLPVVGFLAVYLQWVDNTRHTISTALWFEHLWRSPLETFFPMVLGYRLPNVSVSVGIGVVATIALLVASWRARPSRSWPLAFFGTVLFATLFLSGRQRLPHLGVDTAREARYVVDLLVPLAVTVTVLVRNARPPNLVVGAVLAAYLAVLVPSMPHAHHPWNIAGVEPYLRTLKADLIAHEPELSADTGIYDLDLPYEIMPGWLPPWNRTSKFVSFLRPGLDVETPKSKYLAVTTGGHLAPFTPRAVATTEVQICAILTQQARWSLPAPMHAVDAEMRVDLELAAPATLLIHTELHDGDGGVASTYLLGTPLPAGRTQRVFRIDTNRTLDTVTIAADQRLCVKRFELLVPQ